LKNRFDIILSTLRKWDNCGTRKLNNGTEVICNVPNVAPQAWLHKIYAELSKDEIVSMQIELKQKLPNDLVEFLSQANGINIFSDSLSVWGNKMSYARTGDEAIQPYDMIDLNLETKACKSEYQLIIGSYSWDGSIVLYDFSKSEKQIFRCEKSEMKVLNVWNDIWDWLEKESLRLSTLFDENGYEYDEDIPTVPES
jgi:hypothetical protein